MRCGCSSMVEHQPSKLVAWVRFPSPAPNNRFASSIYRETAKCACSAAGESIALLRRVSGVRIPSGAPPFMAGVAQLVRASDCGPEGRGFDSRLPPHYFIGVSPSGKAPDFDSGIRRSESCHPSQKK